ncbi:HAD family hydrolase [Devosia nitrariae]|uniref:Haloacid dehalogenase n=1 Tax=Devosia nitrariae TaxID=2071872 RepID=A0ABQ5WBB7_9HYPH|nr:HAD family hydrolase [Devosia nitrariae]GLQ57388.1 haloacid dehalogenase [Devosia nitrariae]
MRAVLFDIDGVLVHSRFHPEMERRRFWDEHLLTDLGIEPSRFQSMFGPGFDAVITGERSLIEVLDGFLPTIGYNGSTLRFLEYWLERDTNVNYALVEQITRLRGTGDVKVFLATNQEHLRANYLWRELRLGHIFDDMLYAARLGAAKPSVAFFERAAVHLTDCEGVPLFFDDSEKVVAGARDFGWEAVLFNEIEHFTDHPWVAGRLARS